MEFDSRLWKLDLENLWWNANRIEVRDSLIDHLSSGRGPAHLTGRKGSGKSTLAALIAKRLNATIIRLNGDTSDYENDYNYDMLILDEAQKVTLGERKRIMKENPNVLMVSVKDLTDDGYTLVRRIESLNNLEIKSYVNYHKSLDIFTDGGIDELTKASRGQMRLINTLCKAALETGDPLINRQTIEFVAKKKFKLRYK